MGGNFTGHKNSLSVSFGWLLTETRNSYLNVSKIDFLNQQLTSRNSIQN